MTEMIIRRVVLPGLLLTTAFEAALAQNTTSSNTDRLHGPGHEHEVLEEIVVTATPLRRDVIELSQSATVLSGAALDRELGNSIGDTLARVPGMANASFGQNVGRPVIRGMQGARIGVLSNNMVSSDASAVSQDHAVPIEPFLADQVEVLRGPATLLYGSGAIGGVVNVVSHTIPQSIPEDGFEARALLQADTAADQRFAAGRVDIGAGSFAFHADGFVRRTDDYEIPHAAALFPGHDDDHDGHEEEHEEDGGDHDGEGHDDEMTGVLENSFLDNEGGALGMAWIGDTWRFGLAVSGYDSDYGIPGAHGHGHDEHDEEEHAGEEHDEHEEGEHGHEEEEFVTVGLESRRIDGEIEGTDPFRGFERLKVRWAVSDYEHTEFEGEEVGTVFTNDTTDLRLELRHQPWGVSSGAFGIQYTDRDFGAVGEEAFVPDSTTRTGSLFWVESLDFGGWTLDAGVRYEDVDVDAVPGEGAPLGRSFTPFSASIGAVWHLNENSHLTFNFSRAERAPTDQELFALGPHIANQSFEVGDPDLNTERNLHMEGGFRVHQGRLTGTLTLYTDSFSDYIYPADTGTEEDGLPVRAWSQQDAEFWGGEVELRFDAGRWASGHWQFFGFADAVRAEFDDDTNVPRLPPHRLGFGLDWDREAWTGNLTWIHAGRQDRTAAFETETPGYDLLNAEVSYLLATSGDAEFAFFAKARNLLDEDIRHSTSFLKDQAPQIGRNFVFGVKIAY